MDPGTCEGVAPREGPPQDDRKAAKLTESPRSRATVAPPVDELAARRELRAWIRTVAWLNVHGFAAAVPGHLVVPLRGRGLEVWASDQPRIAA